MAITTAGNGNWSSTTPNAPWPFGTLPTNADDVIIAQNHTVTLDNAAVCKSLVLNAGTAGNVGGKLLNATGANISLTIQQGITNSYAVTDSTRNPQILFDMSADASHTLTLLMNNSAAANPGYGITSTSLLTLKGASKTSYTVTNAALTKNSTTSVVVADATNWRVGDALVFATTQPFYNPGGASAAIAGWSTSTWSWAAGKLTVTLSGSPALLTNMEVGDNVIFQTGAMIGNYVVTDVVDNTKFKVACADPGAYVATSVWPQPRTDIVTIATITPGSGTTATITWSDGNGTGGAVAHDHATACVVANFTRNLIVKGPNALPIQYSTTPTWIAIQSLASSTQVDEITNVMFTRISGSTTQTQMGLIFNTYWQQYSSVSNNSFYQNEGIGFGSTQIAANTSANYPTRQNNVYYSDGRNFQALYFRLGYTTHGPVTGDVCLKATTAFVSLAPATSFINCMASGCQPNVGTAGAVTFQNTQPGSVCTNCEVWSTGVVFNAGQMTFNGGTIGTKYSGATNNVVAYPIGDVQITIDNTTLDASGGYGFCYSNITLNSNASFVALYNKNNNTAVQELYTNQSSTVPAIQREYAASPQKFTRSTSAMCFTSSRSPAITTTESILAENGVAVTIICYMVTSHVAPAYGASTLPSISLSGLGITPQTATYVDISTGALGTLSSVAGNGFHRSSGSFVTDGFAAGDSIFVEGFASNNGTFTIAAVTATDITTFEATTAEVAAGSRAISKWYKATVTATQSSGADGNLTLTYTSQSATAGAKAWFAGVPNSPYMSRCRHYGYLYDETVPTRTANVTVSASEATAQAYTGISVAWGSPSPVTINGNTTFQNLYDYTQAWACANVASALPLTGAGVAGSPSLFAAANLTINTTKVLNGSGSISMGAYTLTSEFASGANPAYTYTGGTWAQSTTVPTFTGGTLAMAGEGTYSFTALSSIITFAPTANAVTYNLSGGTFSGTIDLRNTHATRAITVQLPAGVSYTTANNTGAAITVTLPATYQSVTVSGATAGSRIQIYDNTSATELYNGTPTFPYTWTDSVPAAANRQIRLRVAYCTSSTANVFIDTVIGTCGTSSPSNDISYLVSPVVDAVYVANLIDGTTITDCSISGTSLHVDINTGAVTWQHIYAFMTYWLFTSGGIRDQYLEMTATDQTHYVFATAHGSFKIKNVSSPTAPLVVTGGNAAPDSGSVVNILDTTGGTIFCIEGTVVPFTTSSQAVNQATVEAGVAAQANAIADALLDRTDAIEVGLTPRKSLRLNSAVLGGKLSGGGTTTNIMRNAVADSKVRVTATVDSDGNRTAITTDLT